MRFWQILSAFWEVSAMIGTVSGPGTYGMGGAYSYGLSGTAGTQPDSTTGTNGEDYDPGRKPGYKSSPAECKTCRERKYQDGSDENVSFKSAAHISPNAAGAAVRAHEGEHVSNAYLKAEQEGGRVLSVGVSIHTAVCPECGRVYVSGGTTHSVIESGSQEQTNPYAQQQQALNGILNTGSRVNQAG